MERDCLPAHLLPVIFDILFAHPYVYPLQWLRDNIHRHSPVADRCRPYLDSFSGQKFTILEGQNWLCRNQDAAPTGQGIHSRTGWSCGTTHLARRRTPDAVTRVLYSGQRRSYLCAGFHPNSLLVYFGRHFPTARYGCRSVLRDRLYRMLQKQHSLPPPRLYGRR